MKIFFCVAIFLLLFACDEDEADDNKLLVELEHSKENIVGDWVSAYRIVLKEKNDSSNYDTSFYEQRISLYEDGNLYWAGDIHYEWSKDTLKGNGKGNWLIETDSSRFGPNKVLRITLLLISTIDSTDVKNEFVIVGEISKLTKKEIVLDQFNYKVEKPYISYYLFKD